MYGRIRINNNVCLGSRVYTSRHWICGHVSVYYIQLNVTLQPPEPTCMRRRRFGRAYDRRSLIDDFKYCP